MHFQAQMKKPEFVPFNDAHPHQFFQRVEIETNREGSFEYEKIYLSCPETGLTEELIQEYMVSALGVDEELDSDGLSDGWFWKECQAGAVRVCTVDEYGSKTNSGAIYSVKDPEVLNLRLYFPDHFNYSIDAIPADTEQAAAE